MQNDRPPSPNGFTLIELLVATIIAALAAILMLNAAAGARKRQKLQLNKAQAMLVAQEILSARQDGIGPGRSLTGEKNNFLWSIQETEIEHDPRDRYILINIRATAGPHDMPNLITLNRRQLRNAR